MIHPSRLTELIFMNCVLKAICTKRSVSIPHERFVRLDRTQRPTGMRTFLRETRQGEESSLYRSKIFLDKCPPHERKTNCYRVSKIEALADSRR